KARAFAAHRVLVAPRHPEGARRDARKIDGHRAERVVAIDDDHRLLRRGFHDRVEVADNEGRVEEDLRDPNEVPRPRAGFPDEALRKGVPRRPRNLLERDAPGFDITPRLAAEAMEFVRRGKHAKGAWFLEAGVE